MRTLVVLVLVAVLGGCSTAGLPATGQKTAHGAVSSAEQCVSEFMAYRGQFRCTPVEPDQEVEVIGVFTYSVHRGICSAKALISVQRSGSREMPAPQKLEFDVADRDAIVFGQSGALEFRLEKKGWLSCRKI